MRPLVPHALISRLVIRFDDNTATKMHLQDGNRYCTVLLYLGDVEEGGETALPLAEAIDEVR